MGRGGVGRRAGVERRGSIMEATPYALSLLTFLRTGHPPREYFFPLVPNGGLKGVTSRGDPPSQNWVCIS